MKKRLLPIRKVIKRARVFFVLILGLYFLTAGGFVYAGLKSGEIQKRIIEPLRENLEEVRTIWKELSKPMPTIAPRPTPTPAVRIYIDDKGGYRQGVYLSPTPIKNQYQYPLESYEEMKRKQDEWWNNVKEEHRKLSEEWAKELEEFKKKSEADLERAKKEGEEGLEAFREEQLKKQEEFKKEHGF